MGEQKNDPVTQGALARYRQRMDATVMHYQSRLLGEGGDAWHEVLKKVLEHENPHTVLTLLSGCDKK